jgi:hypothetical protein
LLAYRRHSQTISCRHENRMRQMLMQLVRETYRRRRLDRPVTLVLAPRHGDANRRELARLVSGASKNGSFRTAARYLRRLILRHPFNVRTWTSAASCLLRAVRDGYRHVRRPSAASSRSRMRNQAICGYEQARLEIAKIAHGVRNRSEITSSSFPLHRRVANHGGEEPGEGLNRSAEVASERFPNRASPTASRIQTIRDKAA